MSDQTISHAYRAVAWAKRPYKFDDKQTNWDAWILKLKKEAYNPYKRTIMRNQAVMSMDNSYWPCLSRLALMGYPQLLGKLIKPRNVVELDSESGLELLNKLYLDVTDTKPALYDWHNARKWDVA